MAPKAAIGFTYTYKCEELRLVEGLHVVVHGGVELFARQGRADVLRLHEAHGGGVHHVQLVAHVLQADAHESAVGGFRVHHADGVVQRGLAGVVADLHHGGADAGGHDRLAEHDLAIGGDVRGQHEVLAHQTTVEGVPLGARRQNVGELRVDGAVGYQRAVGVGVLHQVLAVLLHHHDGGVGGVEIDRGGGSEEVVEGLGQRDAAQIHHRVGGAGEPMNTGDLGLRHQDRHLVQGLAYGRLQVVDRVDVGLLEAGGLGFDGGGGEGDGRRVGHRGRDQIHTHGRLRDHGAPGELRRSRVVVAVELEAVDAVE